MTYICLDGHSRYLIYLSNKEPRRLTRIRVLFGILALAIVSTLISLGAGQNVHAQTGANPSFVPEIMESI